jgi:FtsH-binding integral membrane protein
VAWWWALLTLASGMNIALWVVLYRQFQQHPADASAAGMQLMLFLCAAYVFGCAFRSFLPRADVQRICLFDTWLSSVVVGRSVATVAEVCFAAQWALVLHQLGGAVGADATSNIAWAIVPLIVVAQCCSWYGVLTTNDLAHAIENSIWAVAFLAVAIALCRLLPEFDGLVRLALIVAIIGIAAFLAFLITVDVPMYVNRWHEGLADGRKVLGAIEGLRDASTRWVVTHDFAEWKDEIAWMSLYFTTAVWASLALCVVYALVEHLPR